MLKAMERLSFQMRQPWAAKGKVRVSPHFSPGRCEAEKYRSRIVFRGLMVGGSFYGRQEWASGVLE